MTFVRLMLLALGARCLSAPPIGVLLMIVSALDVFFSVFDASYLVPRAYASYLMPRAYGMQCHA